MRKVLLLLSIAAAFTLSSCEKGEEVLPIEDGTSATGGMDYLSPSRPVSKATGGMDYLSPSRPVSKATGGMDYLSPSRPVSK
ncbi:hypothetical protein BH23BAC1_BH23BAC1_12000 [soil metagenome]